MTDRVNAMVVVLEHDTRDDDVEALVAAISTFRNVLTVTPHVSTITDLVAQSRARLSLQRALLDALEKS